MNLPKGSEDSAENLRKVCLYASKHIKLEWPCSKTRPLPTVIVTTPDLSCANHLVRFWDLLAEVLLRWTQDESNQSVGPVVGVVFHLFLQKNNLCLPISSPHGKSGR